MCLPTLFPTRIGGVRLALAELPEVIIVTSLATVQSVVRGNGRGVAMPIGSEGEGWGGTRKLPKTVEILDEDEPSRVQVPNHEGLHRASSAAVGAHIRQQARAHADGLSMNTVEELYKVRSEHFC